MKATGATRGARGVVRLPRDRHGRPVPWFAAWVAGEPDFRLVAPGKAREAVSRGKCWVCGRHLPVRTLKAFVIGPMCVVNRVSSEPPSHRGCAVYSARECPFLTTPGMRRRTTGIPEGAVEPGGVMVRRNPGVAAVWLTPTYRPYTPPGGGLLFQVGDPVEVLWFARGRPARRAEVEASITTGLPVLRAEAGGPGEAAALDAAARAVLTGPLLPAA